MIDLIRLLLGIVASLAKSRARSEAENIVLRQQLTLPHRTAPWPHLSNLDPLVFGGLYRICPSVLARHLHPRCNNQPAGDPPAPRRNAVKCRLGLAVILGLGPFGQSASPAEPDYAAERAQMVRIIENYARQPGSAVTGDHLAPEMLRVMGIVPRHEFVPDGLRQDAYADRPLPIGFGQTISQPFIVAVMTDLLRVGKDDVVLEIGTGSGYQAAVLAHLTRRVYTIEIIPGLAEGAANRLRRLGYSNVETRVGDGYYGWEEAAPFDGIVVTAAATSIPPPLLRQLKPGGRMVIPVGAPFALQYLTFVELDAERRATTRQLLPVAFVPLTAQR